MEEMKTVLVKYFDPTIEKIKIIPNGDWIDLRASQDVTLSQFEFKPIPLGVSMKLPEGFEAHVLPRGSTYKNFGIILSNSMGIVDNSFCGPNDFWFFPAIALRDTKINKGDRICQFRIMKKQPDINFIEVEELKDPDRGSLGSTGTR